MKDSVTLVYTGRERPFIDRIYGTRLEWMPGQARAVPPELAARLLRHADVFKRGKVKQDAPKPPVDDTAQRLEEVAQHEEAQHEEQDAKHQLLDQLRQLDAAGLKAWAKERIGETFKGNPSLATIQERVFGYIEAYGVPA